MITKLKFPNNKVCITRPYVDYYYWISSVNCKNDNDIKNTLDDILNNLDCKRIYNCGRPMMTTYPIYLKLISDYVYYLLKFENQILYNEYHKKLEDFHNCNVEFENLNPIETKPIRTPRSCKDRKKIPPNIFVRKQSTDLFTGEVVYFYENLRTKECIKSTNPDLLDELNKIKKKDKSKDKSIGVPITSMTFSFKKK